MQIQLFMKDFGYFSLSWDTFLFISPLFNQESPIKIKNLFLKGVLAKRQQQLHNKVDSFNE